MGESPTELDQWLRAHGPNLVLYARQWSICHADAEDVFHDAFVKFWRNKEGVREPLVYLYRCVRTAAVDRARSEQRRRRREEAVAEPSMFATAETATEANERREQIEAALEDLPVEQREVVVLKHFSGLSFEKIGAVLKIPHRTAQSRHRYAMEKMRESLTDKSPS